MAAAAADPEQVMMARQDLDAVLDTLETLPQKCRQVFIMHRLHGKPHTQIAAELGITRSMVEKHIMEATARLMKALDSTSAT